jgi:hypothetical protein
MNEARADSPTLGLAGPAPATPEAPPRREPPGEGWSRRRWLALIALAFAVHIGLVFAFGEYNPVAPRVATKVPTLQLVDDPGELLALNDPTLFALPHPSDFASGVWRQMPAGRPPSLRWTESPRWLQLSGDKLGMVFNQFMQTNRFADFPLELRLPPKLSEPVLQLKPAFAETSTLRVEGDLARRQLLNPVALTNWPYADVIAPSKVQALVDAAGNVVSVVLLPADGNLEAAAHCDAADQRALELARAARFTPASRLTIGWLIFDWRTVPPPATNTPSATNEPGR